MDSERDKMAEARLSRGCGVVGRPGQQTFPLAQRRASLKDLADKSAALK